MAEPGTPIEVAEQTQNPSVEVVRDLTDFGEGIPDGYVSVFTTVDEYYLQNIAKDGLKTNYWANKLPPEAVELNERFKEEAEKMGKAGFDRQNTIFAYVDNPNMVKLELYGSKKMIALEIKVDPRKCWVAEIADYEQTQNPLLDEKNKLQAIRVYVGGAMTLKDYLELKAKIPDKRKHPREYSDYLFNGGKDFRHPEVLTGSDIPRGFVRIAPRRR